MDDLAEYIRQRCEEQGDCWEWLGALQSHGVTPMINYKQRVISVRRLIAEHQGHNIKGKVATYKCGNTLCVNPDHVQVLTRAKLSKRTTADLKYHTNPVRMKKLSDAARAKGKLTWDLVCQIREAQGRQRDIAERFGVSQATVSVILRGITWREYTNPFAQLVGGLNK